MMLLKDPCRKRKKVLLLQFKNGGEVAYGEETTGRLFKCLEMLKNPAKKEKL